MSARCPWYVLVVKEYKEWIEVSAVTDDEATEEARYLPGVVRVEKVTWEKNDERI